MRYLRYALLGLLALAGLLGQRPPLSADEDVTPPALVEFSFAPTTIDTSSAEATVTVTVRVVDSQSGVAWAPSVAFNHPGTLQYRSVFMTIVAGDANDGTYQGVATFPQFSASGTWKVERVETTDTLGNPMRLFTSDLAAKGFPTDMTNVAVVDDRNAPTLVELSFAPTTIDTSSGEATVTVTVRVVDSQSGVAWAPSVAFKHPGTLQYRSVFMTLVAGDANDGTYQGAATFPQGSAFGIWKVERVEVNDKLGNPMRLFTPLLEALLFPTDLTNGPLELCGDALDNDGDTFVDEAPPCPALPPNTSVTGAIGSNANGVPVVLPCSALTITEANDPPADSVDIVIKADDGSTVASGSMTSADGTNWTFTFSAPCPGFGRLHIQKMVHSGAVSQNEFGTINLIDPSGIVYNQGTGEPVQGATVTLEVWKGSQFITFDEVANPFSASPAVNPQLTDADGRYGWLVVPGTYRVRVAKEGCPAAVSGEVTVPPPVTDLDVGLSLPPWPVPVGDEDCDGFTSAIESFAGTDPLAACPATPTPNDEDPDAWPPDWDDSQTVDLADLLLTVDTDGDTIPDLGFKKAYGTDMDGTPNEGGGVYHPRFDLNHANSAPGGDPDINLVDLLPFKQVFSMSCTP